MGDPSNPQRIPVPRYSSVEATVDPGDFVVFEFVGQVDGVGIHTFSPEDVVLTRVFTRTYDWIDQPYALEAVRRSASGDYVIDRSVLGESADGLRVAFKNRSRESPVTILVKHR